MKTKTKINCSDWHRGWGYGHNHIGYLEISGDPTLSNSFVWRGHCQGRHGQIWNRGMKVFFTVINGQIVINQRDESKGTLPDERDVKESVRILTNNRLFDQK